MSLAAVARWLRDMPRRRRALQPREADKPAAPAVALEGRRRRQRQRAGGGERQGGGVVWRAT